MRKPAFKILSQILVVIFLLSFSFEAQEALAIGPWQMFFQKVVEKIFQKMFMDSLGLEDPYCEFKQEKALAKIEKVYEEQKGKIKQEYEAERVKLEEEFNKKWSSEKAVGTAEERMERARQAKREEEKAFQALKERYRKEEEKIEEAYSWVLNHFVPKCYSDYREKLMDPNKYLELKDKGEIIEF